MYRVYQDQNNFGCLNEKVGRYLVIFFSITSSNSSSQGSQYSIEGGIGMTRVLRSRRVDNTEIEVNNTWE